MPLAISIRLIVPPSAMATREQLPKQLMKPRRIRKNSISLNIREAADRRGDAPDNAKAYSPAQESADGCARLKQGLAATALTLNEDAETMPPAIELAPGGKKYPRMPLHLTDTPCRMRARWAEYAHACGQCQKHEHRQRCLPMLNRKSNPKDRVTEAAKEITQPA